MAPMESAFFWLALGLYALCTGTVVYAFVFRNGRVLDRLWIPVGIAWLMHTGAIAGRFAAQGHLPWAGDYENGLFGGWFIVLCTLFVMLRRKPMRVIAVGTLPVALLIMGFGVMRGAELAPMAASLKSFWLYIHVLFAWLAFGAYALAVGSGVVYLLKARDGARILKNPTYEKFPSLERLDELTFRYIVFGFITDAVMIASGAIWAKNLWGSYWSWDPVETWSLVSWLLYGLVIHLRLFLGWRGKKMAWLAIAAIWGVIITFFGVTFVVDSSNHIFDVR